MDSKQKQNQEQKRQQFRLVYPVSARPDLTIGTKVFKILDLSENGVRFKSEKQTFAVGVEIDGIVMFSDGQKHPVKGKVLRTTPSAEVILRLSRGVSLAKMMAEQRKIIQQFGDTTA